MTVKKEYKVNDDVWIYGVDFSKGNKITKGKIVASIDLSTEGFGDDLHYIISVPTHIEPLLEVRTWHMISQDDKGPVGSLREIGGIKESDIKKLKQIGYDSPTDQEDDPTPDQIMAALEKSQNGLVHKPLHIKEHRSKRKYYPRKNRP